MAQHDCPPQSEAASRFAQQAEQLSLLPRDEEHPLASKTIAVGAHFITPNDPVIELASGDRLPAVPLAEAHRLNALRDDLANGNASGHRDHSEASEAGQSAQHNGNRNNISQQKTDGALPEGRQAKVGEDQAPNGTIGNESTDMLEADQTNLGSTQPPARTNPLFPPLPLYGPPSRLRQLQCFVFRMVSAACSMAFLAVVILGSAFSSLPLMFRHIWLRLTFRDPSARRPFSEEEKKRSRQRRRDQAAWKRQHRHPKRVSSSNSDKEDRSAAAEYAPTEGGPDPLKCDPAYYARRVGLDIEEYRVQTEDGFIILLQHIYCPANYTPASLEERSSGEPKVFDDVKREKPSRGSSRWRGNPRYPVLMMPGLLQSSGSFCVNDDDSLAFFLAKSGFDVWLGNNRCGFDPEHKLLRYSDPRFWCWNIRQMGVSDLPALISRVLYETQMPKLGLVCHSQGTTETFVALAKGQRPELGQRISVFCALAPAVYAGPLIGKATFKFMRLISPAMFRMIFGIHAFIPFMLTMHRLLPGRLYGAMGYRIFAFLFDWSDDRWDRGLRDRFFQFAPVYVSSESMRWWLGRECFAKQRCILATRSEWQSEEAKDEDVDDKNHNSKDAAQDDDALIAHALHPPTFESTASENPSTSSALISQEAASAQKNRDRDGCSTETHNSNPGNHGSNQIGKMSDSSQNKDSAWYTSGTPPFAFWIAGKDALVDGRRLLRRFARGREPHARLVHASILPEYEHLDVLWAINVIETIGQDLRRVLWQTMPEDLQRRCLRVQGCDGL